MISNHKNDINVGIDIEFLKVIISYFLSCFLRLLFHIFYKLLQYMHNKTCLSVIKYIIFDKILRY